MSGTAEACSVALGDAGLPETGAGSFLALFVVLGIAAIVVGAAPRRRWFTTALGAAFVAGLVLVPPATPATAATSCRLLDVDAVTIDTSGAQNLLPGDRVELLTARVTNPSDVPITVTARLELESDSGPANAFTADLRAATTSVSGPAHGLKTPTVDVAPGETFTTSAVVALGDVDNTLQGVDVVARLTLTAMERR